jgi:hypothetical protein
MISQALGGLARVALRTDVDEGRRGARETLAVSDSPSVIRTTRRSPRCQVMKSKMSAVVTSTGSLTTTEKNTFKS